jgi:hypothetical protein
MMEGFFGHFSRASNLSIVAVFTAAPGVLGITLDVLA